MIERSTFVTSKRDFIGMGSERILTCLFLSYCTDKASLHNCLRGNFEPSPMFFGVVGLFGRKIQDVKVQVCVDPLLTVGFHV